MDLMEKFRKEGKMIENDKVTYVLVENEKDLIAVLEFIDIWEETPMVIDLSPHVEYIKLLYEEHNKKNKIE